MSLCDIHGIGATVGGPFSKVPAARNPSPAQQITRKRGPPRSWQGDRERPRSGFPPASQGRRRRSGLLLRQRRAVPERGLASPEFAANSRPPKRAPSCTEAATPLAIKPLAISRELCLCRREPAPHVSVLRVSRIGAEFAYRFQDDWTDRRAQTGSGLRWRRERWWEKSQ
jgi:hypothetical protein